MEDRFIHVVDSTSAILSVVEQLGRLIRGDKEDNGFPDKLPESVVIPQEFENIFTALTKQIYPDLSTIPLDRGIDTAVLYFTAVIKTADQQVQSKIKYLIAVVNTMKATWMVRTVRASQGYQIAARCNSERAFEQQIDQWGMTIDRFLDQFEDVSSSIS